MKLAVFRLTVNGPYLVNVLTYLVYKSLNNCDMEELLVPY